ncbi:zinc-binding dehydrogenase [Mucilaginibacter sp. P19]|uniref:zinc-binding dehydrogenase n=1 Tax=Mucilaginibacter sp. P19 TaxID=3423947 RepID=UPI003D669FF9
MFPLTRKKKRKKINGLSSFAQEKVPGDTVLVEGATGGLGSSSVQLAKLYGVSKVLGAASTPEKRAIAESLGADATVDYTQSDWPEQVKQLTDGKGVYIIL